MVLLLLSALVAGAEPMSLRPGATFAYEGLTLRAWGTAEGLPQATVEEAVQTEDGFLWLATYGGLVRFDGQRFKTYEMAEDDSSYTLRISGLAPASGGGLWLGMERGGVVYFDGHTFEAPPGQPEVLETAAVLQLLSDGEDLWLGTTAGLIRRSGASWQTLVPTGYEGKEPFVRDLARCDDGSIWAATHQGTGRVVGDRLVRIGEPSAAVLCRDDRVYVGTMRGVSTWDGQQLQPLAPLGETSSLAICPNDSLWAGGKGFIARLDEPSKRWELAGEIIELASDVEGNLWAGTRKSGLVRLSPQPYQHLDSFLEGGHSPGPLVSDGETLLIRREGLPVARLWQEGGRWQYGALDPAEQEAFEGAEQQPEGQGFVGVVAIDAADGELALASGERVWRLGGPTLLELDSDEPRVLRYDREGAIWVGTSQSGAYRLHDGEVQHLTTADGLQDDRIINIVPAPDGSLWLTHPAGVSVLHRGQIRTLDHSAGLPPGQVRAIWFDPEGRPWLGTYGGGLGLVDGDRVHRFTTAQGLYDDVISAILYDDSDGVWMNGNRGLFRVRYSELDALASGSLDRVQSWPLPTGEGNGARQPAAATLSDGRLAFTMVDGLVLLDPERVSSRVIRPQIHIEALTADGEPLPDGAQIAPGSRELLASYTSPSLSWPELIRYQSRLVQRGDEPWSAPAADRQIRILGLKPGTYTLEVRAINERGEVSEAPASITFTLLPFWWQTRSARVLSGLALIAAGALFGTVRWRLERRHATALREQIRQRERAERERAALSEQLARAQRLEAVGRLAGGIAHDFNNLLTAVFANVDLLQLQLDPPSRDTSECLDGIRDATQRASELVKQLLAFSRQQVLKPRRYDLNQSMRALEPMLCRFARRNIALKLDLPDEPMYIFADPSQLDLVLVNLCINAVDAMPSGGSLRLSLRRAGERAQITVTDTGAGIPEEDLPRIFEPFFTTKPVGKGTGLGLASALGIVTQSGGDIQVESRAGEGTTFTIQLPLAG